MSEKDHPNFHVVNFTTEIIKAYFDSLRGMCSREDSPDVHDEILAFVSKIENKVDRHAHNKFVRKGW